MDGRESNLVRCEISGYLMATGAFSQSVDPCGHCRDCNTAQYLGSTLAGNAVTAVSCPKNRYQSNRKLCLTLKAASFAI